ncbi:MAG: hypothetical protein GW748_08105 [Alphaproteobacteria bacterium]|nr:hypothetical protein [Alphaproteobacteria bacterium]NCQ67686.1 hypothetical protein [Alphaproteobacteria bacterium]NCT07552.1 hypothetical protein [Alphaproteobacteria bacterium]
MKKKFILPLVLSTALLATPHKAKAYVPVAEIIVGIELATSIAIAAKPLVKMAYKAVKKGGKDFIRFIKNHRGHHKTKREPLEEESLIPSYAPALVPMQQDLDERFNTVTFKTPTYGYSHRIVRYEEETRYFGGGF